MSERGVPFLGPWSSTYIDPDGETDSDEKYKYFRLRQEREYEEDESG